MLRGRQSRGEADAFAKPSNLGYNVPLTWIPEPYSVPASLPECKTSLLSASPRKRRHVKNYTPLQFPDVSAPKMTRNLRPATCPPRARYFADRKEKPLLSNPLEQSLQKMSNDFSKAVSEEMGMRESIKRDIALHKEQLPILYRWEQHIDVHLCREYARAHLERMFDSVSRAVPRLALRKWCHIARVERRLEYVKRTAAGKMKEAIKRIILNRKYRMFQTWCGYTVSTIEAEERRAAICLLEFLRMNRAIALLQCNRRRRRCAVTLQRPFRRYTVYKRYKRESGKLKRYKDG